MPILPLPPRLRRLLPILLAATGAAALLLHALLGWRGAGPDDFAASEASGTELRAISETVEGRPGAVLAELRRREQAVAPEPYRENADPRLRSVAEMLLLLAEGGNAQAQWRLGWYRLNGWGVARDRCSATAWFERAARQGQPQAQFRLAVALLPPNGQGVAPDPLAAVRWATAARANGHVIGDAEFATLFLRNLSPEERTAAEASLAGWSPAREPPLTIRRFPYMPVLSGLWPRQTHHVMPCRQPEAPYEKDWSRE